MGTLQTFRDLFLNRKQTIFETMLQKTKADIEQFYKDVEQRGFRFPVAALRDATGASKGYVSEILARKKEPSQAFLDAYYKKYPKSSQNGHAETTDEGDIGTYWTRFDRLLLMAERHSDTINKLSEAHLLLAKQLSSGKSSPSFVLPPLKDIIAAQTANIVGKSKTDSTGKSKQKGNDGGSGK